MSLEPAMAALIGLIVLQESLHWSQWIAVLSWWGEDYREGIGLSIGLLPAAPSRFFVDIYEVGSGGRIVAIDGVDRDFIAGDAPLADSFWLESGHFVVPLGSTRQKLLVCEIPAM